MSISAETDVLVGVTVLFGVGSWSPHLGVRGEMPQRVKRPILWARVCSQSFQPAVPAGTASLRTRSCSDQTLTGSLVHQNSVPSVHMHRRITAILRATATRAFLEPMRRTSRVPKP